MTCYFQRVMRIYICSGGSLGHVCAGVLSSHQDVEVNMFTQHPELWSRHVHVTDIENKVFNGESLCYLLRKKGHFACILT